MKKLVFLMMFMTMGLVFSATAQPKIEKKAKALEEIVKGPNMELESTVVDYGTIEEDSDPYRYFKFTNTGTEPLVIKHAKGSCGCTVPSYKKEPIMPGESSELKVRYATNRIGAFSKTVTITTNEGSDAKGKKRILTIKGKVNKKAAAPKAVPSSAPSILNQ